MCIVVKYEFNLVIIFRLQTYIESIYCCIYDYKLM